EYSPIEVDTEVLKLINTSNHSTAQVGKVFGIPRHKFGLETANMNISEMNMDYLVNTLSPYLESIVSEIEYKLIDDSLYGGIYYKFNTDEYKMIDAETKVKNAKIKLETGISSINEVREDFGDEPIGEVGDKHFVSLNLASLEMIDEYQMNKASNLPLKGGESDDDMIISGYALKYDTWSQDLGGFVETIDKRALDKADLSDVRCLIDHDSSRILGRTKSGTLELEKDDIGLRFECTLPNTTYARD